MRNYQPIMQKVHLGWTMRLEWLEDLLAVAETGSFSEAAERRHLTQSAFSRRIHSIENYVGVELFDRTRKPVQLQRTTSDQRDQILRVVRTLRQLVEDLKHGSRRSEARIVLASQHALTTSRTPELVQRIHAARRDVHVRLRSANLDECFGLLLARHADIALVYRLEGEEHPIEADYIETADIGTERLIPVHASGDVAWLETRRSAGELPIIAYPAEVFLGSVMHRIILPRLGGELRALPKGETALTLAALELAAVGIGVAWVPASLTREPIANGSLADLSTRLPSCGLTITAMRLGGQAREIEALVWKLLTSACVQVGPAGYRTDAIEQRRGSGAA